TRSSSCSTSCARRRTTKTSSSRWTPTAANGRQPGSSPKYPHIPAKAGMGRGSRQQHAGADRVARFQRLVGGSGVGEFEALADLHLDLARADHLEQRGGARVELGGGGDVVVQRRAGEEERAGPR